MSAPHRYRSAVKALRKTFPDDARRQELEAIVIRSCDAAIAYDRNDWFKGRRTALKRAREKREMMTSAARRLAAECRAGNPMLAAAIGPVLEARGYVLRKDIHRIAVQHGNLTAGDLPPANVVLGDLLAGIADQLESADIDALADPLELHARRRHGNMEFLEDIGRKRLPGVDSMLAFQLEFYMRAFVAGRPFAPDRFDTPTGNALRGKPHRDLTATMRDGKPHRDLIVRFVQAAIPTSKIIDRRVVEDRITELIPRVLWLDDFR